MTNLLIHIFIKDRNNTSDPVVRTNYGYLGAFTGIALNILLFLGKLIAGIISGAVSVMADAFNNLSDAGSSIMTFVGFKMASMPADNEHPYGHGRMEYVSGLIIAVIIMLMGFELGKTSVEKIINPEEFHFSVLTLGILIASVLVKLWMALFNRKLGKIINSKAMKATAMDSLTDCISTTVVILTMLLALFTGINLDAYAGLLVAAFILYTGFNTFKDSLTPLLGEKPSPELVKEIEDTVMSYPGIIGVHDLMVHDYGVGNMIISMHAEVPCKSDIMKAHELIDLIEDDLKIKYKSIVSIHMDPVANDDEETIQMKEMVTGIVKDIDEVLSIHDFRMTKGTQHINFIFDLVTPFKFRISDGELVEIIRKRLDEIDESYFAVITVEHSMC
ncbi:MAG: cation transporter [Ruminiclostridium sp.]|nr:cation transporter [Ruminiclostridium sp.]